MRLHKGQAELMGQAMFIEKLDHAFCRDIPEFGELDADARADFLVACLRAANAMGLVTEQGVASYALAAWWLEIGFEDKSRYLKALFASGYPEVRKVYAMNEWAHAVIGAPDNMEAADEKLKQAFYRTQAWGR